MSVLVAPGARLLFFIAHRVQHSHCWSTSIEVCRLAFSHFFFWRRRKTQNNVLRNKHTSRDSNAKSKRNWYRSASIACFIVPLSVGQCVALIPIMTPIYTYMQIPYLFEAVLLFVLCLPSGNVHLKPPPLILTPRRKRRTPEEITQGSYLFLNVACYSSTLLWPSHPPSSSPKR